MLNIGTFNLNKDEVDFPNRIFLLSQNILLKDFDILCLQEDFKSENFSSSDVLNNELKFFKTTIKTRQKRRQGVLSSSNLTVLSRLKPRFVEHIYFDEIPYEQRGAIYVGFLINGKNILIVNTHLCHLEEKNRLYQIEKILDKSKSFKSDEIIICGDFNSTPNSKVISFLKNNDFVYNNIKNTAKRGKIIDYIFYRNSHFLKSEIILKEYSDHFCLCNSLKFC
jgi:endonuclease/exonuclease/phosphatase family metal-dependent hydrolase